MDRRKEVDSYKQLVIVLLVVLAIMIIKLNTVKTQLNMNVYLSKAKTTVPEDLVAIKRELQGCNLFEYLGGAYSDADLFASDVVITILGDDSFEQTIGRGQFEEMSKALERGIPVVLVYMNLDDDIVEIYELDDKVKLEGGSWKEYGTIYISPIYSYDFESGQFEDYIKSDVLE